MKKGTEQLRFGLVVTLTTILIVDHLCCLTTNARALCNNADYLTDAELSQLYTLREDERKIDETIIEVSQEDAMMLMKLAKAETGDYSAEAQAYHMMVVLNRVNSELFPDTVYEVLHQDRQFSTVKSGAYDKAVPDEDTHYALYLVESGQIQCDALFFEAEWVENSWQSKHRKYLFTFEGTTYYE